MLAYKDAVDGLYSFSVAEFTRRQELSAKIETRTAQGKWGLSDKDDEDPHQDFPGNSPAVVAVAGLPKINTNSSAQLDDQMLPALRTRLTDLSGDFRTRVNVLLGDLAVQPDVDMKFLGVVMNFNDVYTPRKRRREHHRERRTPGNHHGGEGEREGGGKGAEEGKGKERK